MNGHYKYIDHLMAMDSCKSKKLRPLPDNLTAICTPLRAEKSEKDLVGFPDRACVDYLLRGISKGFRVKFPV